MQTAPPELNLIKPRKLRLQPVKTDAGSSEAMGQTNQSGPWPCAGTTVVDPQELSSPERLVEESKAGSAEAFGLLVEHFEHRIFNFLCQMTGNTHDAEDLAQETFLKAYRSIHRFDSGQS